VIVYCPNCSDKPAPVAEPVPPAASPADVYLVKLESLLRENARLRASLGECRAILAAVVDLGINDLSPSSDFLDGVADPAIKRLAALLD
jgi:hypothetical protein